MFQLMLFKIFLLLSLNILYIDCGKCPPTEAIHPCLCNETHIECGDIHEINLKKIFSSLSDYLGNNSESKEFKEFILNNTQIVEIEANVFNDIKFKIIRINDTINLRHIDRNAFKSIAESVEEFWQDFNSRLGLSPNPKPDSFEQLFEALRALPNVKQIGLDKNLITEIPDNAFSKQKLLTDLYFPHFLATNGSIARIGNNAFYHLESLKRVYFENNKLNTIPAKAFDFEKSSDIQLLIQLNNNLLNETSFEVGIFNETKRPVNVILTNNKIQYLDEKVFGPVFKLNNKNKFNFMGNPFECDCRMKWLFRLKNDIQQQIILPKCIKKGKFFWELNENDLNFC